MERKEPPLDGDEAGTLLGFLEYQRQTFAWKTAGVDEAGLRQRVGASTMTLGGLLHHLAHVEDGWFSWHLRGDEWQPPWDVNDWDADPDWEWRTAADLAGDELRARWEAAVDRARASAAEALASGGLGQVAVRGFADGTTPSLRWILVHMIEEYARHNGHADLLREAVDGQTGE